MYMILYGFERTLRGLSRQELEINTYKQQTSKKQVAAPRSRRSSDDDNVYEPVPMTPNPRAAEPTPAKMAEYGWSLSDETLKKARLELNENPDTRCELIDAVREQMDTRPDIDFLRTDDAFLVRFLRARKFDAFETFKLYARYFEYRQTNRNLFRKFHASEPGIKSALFDGFPGVLPQTDHYGRKILILYAAHWDNCHYGLAAIYRAILLTLEKLIEDEETQVNGFVIIVDWSGFTFKQSTWIHPRLLKLMIEGLQDCFPARFAGIHFVNQPWYVEAAFKVVRPFLKDRTKEKFLFHGNNLTTLHSSLHRDMLPAELGGSAPPYNTESWAKELVGDETFSYGENHIYWPDHSAQFRKSETFPIDSYTSESCSKPTVEEKRTVQLDEEFFLMD
ncbi:clavesin-2-like [Tubulanus polymorphus]|uniref:clavesin-2-like n=1 Tax=Tubulanus polymorphus TaxID=672921 RepID=UPI003DA41535